MSHSILIHPRFLHVTLAGLLVVACGTHRAGAQFALNNPSFESPVLSAGDFNYNVQGWTGAPPGDAHQFIEHISGFSADGNQHVGIEEGWSIWQDLGTTFQADQVYRLRVAVGNRAGWTIAGNSSVFELLAADDTGVAHAVGTYNASGIPSNSFVERELLLDTYDYPQLVGHPIRIRLTAGGNGRSHFDHVRLDSNVILVTNTNDAGPGSLRQAVLSAGTFVFPETIRFDPALSGQTIVLTSGEILINKRLTIDAAALPGGITIDGNGNSRLFNIVDAPNGSSLDFFSVTLRNGRAPGGSTGNGGAILINENTSARLTRCTLTGNTAATGGAIFADRNTGLLQLIQCTLQGNSAINAGAIGTYGPLTLNHCTFAGNSASANGGGIYFLGASFTMNNTIVAGNTPNQIVGTISSGSNNLTTGDPKLSPLGNFGGGQPTLVPLAGSPAIDAGGATTQSTDQRGLPRIVGAGLDIGAVESGNAVPGFPTVVTTAADTFDGRDSKGISLREALVLAPKESTITFDPALAGGTILLAHGQLTVARSLNVNASALAGGITIDGDGADRVIDVVAGLTATLDSLTITGGNAAGPGGGIRNHGWLTVRNSTLFNNAANHNESTPNGSIGGDGGGIYNGGVLIVTNTVLTANTAPGSGGGIHNVGNLTLIDTALSQNSGFRGGGIYNDFGAILTRVTLNGNSAGSSFGGGGLYNGSGGTVVADDSSFIGNQAAQNGGGVANQGTLTLNRANLANNVSSSPNSGGGGALFNRGTATLNGASVTGNSGYFGGGILNDLLTGSSVCTLNNVTVASNAAGFAGGGIYLKAGRMDLLHCTISGNSDSAGAGGAASVSGTGNQFNVQNTIIASNPGGDVVLEIANSSGGNLIGTGTGLASFNQPGDQTNADPMLLPLGFYGGAQPVLPPRAGSPVIDAANTSGLATDQRGFSRPLGHAPDIGAVEIDYVTIDGTRDGTYGSAVGVQMVPTGFGDVTSQNPSGSELDAGYAWIEQGWLHLLLTGNLEPNFNKLEVFIDSRPGGENTLSGTPQYDFFNGSTWLSQNLGGLTFDQGFAADYHLFARWGGSTPSFTVDFIDRQGGTSAQVPGSSGASPPAAGLIAFGSIAPGSVGPNASASALSQALHFAINNNNVLGVGALGASGGGGAADPASAEAVTTGMEFAIALADLGNPAPGSTIRIAAMINNGDHNYLSNQLLGGLPPGTGNLGGDGAGGFTGTLSGVNLQNIPGTQFFSVTILAAPALQIQKSSDTVTVGWTGSLYEWGLQSTTSLGAPASWMDDMFQPTSSGNQQEVQMLPDGDAHFFQLRRR